MIDPFNFVAIGEKVHCSRIYKSGGIKTVDLGDNREAVAFNYEGKDLQLIIPANWGDISPAYAEGKIKHVALAIHTALNSEDESAIECALNYLFALTAQQLEAGASYIDLNVDEYAPDTPTRVAAMRWLASTLALQFDSVSFSIDSSDPAVLRAGLESASVNSQRHLLNSISLERTEAIQSAVEFQPAIMVSAAGRETMPTTAEQKTANLREMIALLDKACVNTDQLLIDPLVLPISTDGENGRKFLADVQVLANEFPDHLISGGLSNVSFGMPRRKLLNSVFMKLAIEAGCSSGIIDPTEVTAAAAMEMDTESESYKLSRNFLLGEDDFGMEFIAAHRDGRLD